MYENLLNSSKLIPMKKLIFLLIAIMLITSCDKDGQIFASKDKLPPVTQTGANTVGCLVNGKVFLPHAEGINPEVNCFYQFVDGEFYFTMGFTDLRNGGSKSVIIQTRKTNLESGQTYLLNKNQVENADYSGGCGVYWLNSNNISYTNTIKTGELKITRVDLSHSIISGTFWFDAVNSAGEKVEIREGRFDWNY